MSAGSDPLERLAGAVERLVKVVESKAAARAARALIALARRVELEEERAQKEPAKRARPRVVR